MRVVDRWAKIAGWLLVGLVGAVAFALACYEVTDRDLWWQLRSGEWILQNRQVPSLDPFSYGSVGREWVDLHWLFQIVLAGVYRLAGLSGAVLMAAIASAAGVLVAFAASARNRSLGPQIVCWAPALALIGWRLPPRPELFSLVFLAIYLAVIEFARDRPKLLWSLPIVQLLWVNSHGLFILGPLVLGLAFVEQAAQACLQRRRANRAVSCNQAISSAWRRTGLVLAIVVAACFANPYFARGAMFPWQLLPKISDADNLYKQSVGEFRSPSRAFGDYRGGVVEGGWYVGLEYFLLATLPISFVLPAVQCAWRETAWEIRRKSSREPERPVDWTLTRRLLVSGLAIAPAAASVYSLPGPAKPDWLLTTGNYAPWAFVLLGLAGAGALRRSVGAAAMAVCGAAACAAWLAWLRLFFCGANSAGSAVEQIPALGALALVSAVAAVCLALRYGASLYRVLLAAAFGYLALQAIRNAPLFGLVAGFVLAANFGSYLESEVCKREPHTSRFACRAALAGRIALAGALIFWLYAIVNDHYYGWLRHSRQFGFAEKPFWSAHDASRFAGRPDMPERAVAIGFEQAGVYLYHNAPKRKPYLDPRLELADAEVYRNYVELLAELAENDRNWPSRLHEIGDPLVLVAHAEHGRHEASLLIHPDWRCVYFDAVAAVFVRRGQATAHPALNFAARRFRGAEPSIPNLPGAVYQEATALCRLASQLKRFPERTWEFRRPLLLAARERAEFALHEEAGSARAWALLGNCLAAKIDDRQLVAAIDEWDSARDLPRAQAAFAYRRALEAAPADPEALAGLYQLFAAAGLLDAQLAAGARLQKIGWVSPSQAAEIERLKLAVDSPRQASRTNGRRDKSQEFFQSLQGGRALAALAFVEQDAETARDGSVAASAARVYLLLGAPERARQILLACPPPADHARQTWMIADSYAAEQRIDAAAAAYDEMLAKRPDLAGGWLALATLKAESGDAAGALEACRAGLKVSQNDTFRTDLSAWERLLVSAYTDFTRPTHHGLTFQRDNRRDSPGTSSPPR